MLRDDGIKTYGPYEIRTEREADENLENLYANWSDYRERLVVFLGAGASAGARDEHNAGVLPAAYALRDRLWTDLMNPAGTSNLGTMTLEHTAAIIESRKGRQALTRALKSAFSTRRSLWMHVALPFLNPRAIFTTNYDQLVEQGWSLAATLTSKLPALLPVFAENQKITEPRIPLFKPHGSVDRAEDKLGQGGLVLTLFDYFDIIGSKREMIREWLRAFNATCAIFVGYSFMDTDIGSFLYQMRRESRDIPWYAVFPRGDADVRRMYQDKLGIRQINRTFAEFMRDVDERLDFLPAAFKYSEIDSLISRDLIQ